MESAPTELGGGSSTGARLSPDDKKRDTQLNTSTSRERVEEKIVNFLGIKQSWWEVTSPLHALVMDVYLVGYLLFGLEYEGHPTDVILRAAVHLLGVSGGLMLFMLLCIHTGAFLMMIHDRYREWRDEQIRAAKEEARAAEEGRLAAEEAIRTAEEAARTAAEENRRAAETIAQIAAWNERRLHALETGVPFDEPMPNGTNGAAVEQLRQEQSEFHAWYERRIEAAEKGEPFDEPPPNGNNEGRG